MNNVRRKVLSKAEGVLEDIQGEIEALATDDDSGEQESEEQRDARVKGWQAKLEEVQSDVIDARMEEEEAKDNTRSEDKQYEMEQAISNLEDFDRLMDDLVGASGDNFIELFHQHYDEAVDHLQEAGQ